MIGRPTITYRVARFRVGGLLPGYLAVRVHASAILHGRPLVEVQYTIYQSRGRALSAIYAQGIPSALGERLADHAARQSAGNLLHG
ncbi:MAG TPA: hypothetical protein VG275_08650 [Solirubrobacteraceae bacterium]|nr:hypothetical protein [Solirubrobacteraceae bacterium]